MFPAKYPNQCSLCGKWLAVGINVIGNDWAAVSGTSCASHAATPDLQRGDTFLWAGLVSKALDWRWSDKGEKKYE